MNSKPVLSQIEVSQILAAARSEAQNNQWAVTIVIVDDGGHPWPSNAWTAAPLPAPTSPPKKRAPPRWAAVSPKAMKRWSTAGDSPFCQRRC